MAVLFLYDNTTGATSVQSWVVITVLLLLGKFAMGFLGPQVFSSRRFVAPCVSVLHMLNSASVNYTLGLMKPSSSSGATPTAATVNDFFKIWAVLIVTMQDSIRIGRPYMPKKMTLVDLLSSLWSANQLQGTTRRDLMVPLWSIWSIHTLRIIWYYVSSNRATEASLSNIKLVSDYMMTLSHTDSGEHQVSSKLSRGLQQYRYIVIGEEQQMMEVKPPDFEIEMDLTGPMASQLITVEKVWNQAQDSSDRLLSTVADSDSRFKDVCLSFALYKLQRRRFYNFPIAEATHPATSWLVSGGILEEGASSNSCYDRALRITEVEISFLHDFFYSRHATVFAGGFPWIRILLSLLMTAAALYLVYAVRYMPSIGTAVIEKRKFARITHGVAVTHCIIGIIVYRELLEIGIYVLSQWTKVRIICWYIRLKLEAPQGRIGMMKLLVTEKAARIMFAAIRRGRWDQHIRQYNLLMSARTRFPRSLIVKKALLSNKVKGALFQTLKTLVEDVPSALQQNHHPSESSPHGESSEEESVAPKQRVNRLLTSYFRNAFGVTNVHNPLRSTPLITDPTTKLEGETHKILVWHIATSLCQIKLLNGEAGQQCDNLYSLPRPFLGDLEPVWEHYITAVSISNYCGYLVTQALVPDNGLLANKVFDVVRDEVRRDLGNNKWRDIHTADANLASHPKSILGISEQLAKTLLLTYERDGDLWKRLAKFWVGFLLHLSASTRAAKHLIHLQGRGELSTHLWVLLSHAGFLGETSHGEQLLDPIDLNDA